MHAHFLRALNTFEVAQYTWGRGKKKCRKSQIDYRRSMGMRGLLREHQIFCASRTTYLSQLRFAFRRLSCCKVDMSANAPSKAGRSPTGSLTWNSSDKCGTTYADVLICPRLRANWVVYNALFLTLWPKTDGDPRGRVVIRR